MGSAVEDLARPEGGVGVETEPNRAPGVTQLLSSMDSLIT